MPIDTRTRPIPDHVPSDEPEVEVLCGVELPKMSPERRHARLQAILAELLEAWAGDRGEVGTEWRFWLARGDQADETTLVPDVAFVGTNRMAPLSDEDAEEPPFAPDVAIEIRSPGDRERNIRRKVLLYLAAGARLVIDVDPLQLRVIAYDQAGERVFRDADTFRHHEVPGLGFRVQDIFARAERKR